MGHVVGVMNFDEPDLKASAYHALCAHGIRTGYELGRLQGCIMRGITQHGGRQCINGAQHDRNNFWVEFQRSGNIKFRCHSSACQNSPLIGRYCNDLQRMLDSNMFVTGKDVDAHLLQNLERLAIAATPGKSKGARYTAVTEQDFYPRLESIVCEYLSHYFVFIKDPSVYVSQMLDSDDFSVSHYKDYSTDKLKNVTKPFQWAFNIWDQSAYRTLYGSKRTFGGSPWADKLPEDEYNQCANAMPLLAQPVQTPTSEELLLIQPLLQHIHNCLCGSNDTYFQQFMAWTAHIAQQPDKKIGWAPVFMSEQGVGKGMILAHLYRGVFGQLAHHVVNFDCLTNHFNSELAWRSFIFIDGESHGPHVIY